MTAFQDDSGRCNHLKEGFYDTERMIATWSGTISQYPTQLYYSVLPFLPSNTYLSRHYSTHNKGISIPTGRGSSWSPLLFTLRNIWRNPTAFAPKGHTVVLAGFSRVDLHDALSGLRLSSIVGPEPPNSSANGVMGATFTPDASEVIVVRHWEEEGGLHFGVVKYNMARQNAQVLWTAVMEEELRTLIRLSEGGSCVAFPESMESGHHIRVLRTNGGEDALIPISRVGDIQDLALTADSAHLIAVAADNTITISDILSRNVLRTLADEDVCQVCISPDGSFLASRSTAGSTRLWSGSQGTLLATLEVPSGPLIFSHTDRLYVRAFSDGRSVCDAPASYNQAVIQSFPFPAHTERIALAPDDSHIAIQALFDTQIWSLKHFGDTHYSSNTRLNTILSVELSRNASLLAVGTQTEIEVWDARMGQRRHIIRSQSANSDKRLIACSPRGDFIASIDRDGIVVVDVQAGALMHTTYPSATGQGRTEASEYQQVGISSDSSRLAARTANRIEIWDLPTGSLLRTVDDEHVYSFKWSHTDLYLQYTDSGGNKHLNTETFQEEDLEDTGDRFRGPPDHLYRDGQMLRIRSPHRCTDHLFAALPPDLNILKICWCGDRAYIVSVEGRLLLLDISGLGPYMKEFCPAEW